MNAPPDHPRVAILAGGVGGAKLVRGLADVLPADRLTVIGNTGDDVERHGLWVSPDMDILTYTLAGVVDEEKGWGYRNETFTVLDTLRELGEETWMNLGDKDLATHLYRTEQRGRGRRATEIALEIAQRLGVHVPVLPPCDSDLQTFVATEQGVLTFQEFYLRERCEPDVLSVTYHVVQPAEPTPEVTRALSEADLLLFGPSNPIASIGPILALPGMRERIRSSKALRVAVSPLVGGRCLKGPTLKMMAAMNLTPDNAGVAAFYGDLIDVLVIDEQDASHAQSLPIDTWVTSTVLTTRADKTRLAREIITRASEQANSHEKARRVTKREA